jgi:hypothetical protein
MAINGNFEKISSHLTMKKKKKLFYFIFFLDGGGLFLSARLIDLEKIDVDDP